MGHRLRNAFLLGIIVGVIVAVVRAARAGERPGAFAGGPSAERFAPSTAARVGLHTTAPPHFEPTDTSPPHGDPIVPHESRTDLATPNGHREPTDTTPPHGDPVVPHEQSASWREPHDDGACPDGYPIKAKSSSRIYHVPGGLSYDRTQPERCYATPRDAEADGFRAAKR